jgi:hypothetical protein
VRARALVALAPLVVALLAAEGSFAAGPPRIVETWVTDITATSANLRAEIDPEGASTTYRFEYLTQAAYDANLVAAREGFSGAQLAPPSGAALLGSGSVAIPVFQHVGSLAPETTYRYRVRAAGSAGTGYGEERLLTTAAPTNVFPSIDGRGYELVSPAEKDGGAVGAPESIFGGGDFQAAAAGESLTFSSYSSFGEALGAPPASQYLATRGASGWATRNVSAPLEAGGYGDEPDGVPFRVFSPDLSRALMLNGSRCAVEGTCPPGYSLWESGSFLPLPTRAGLRLAGATTDLSHAVFEAEGALYRWSGGALETVAPGPGEALAASIGAVSEDGQRVYSYQGEDGPISLHEAGRAARALPETTGVSAQFQTASANGTFAFFTAAGHLYRFAAATGTAADLTPSGGVVGVLGASAGGDVVYYQDGAGLERWQEGAGVATAVPGADAAAPTDYPPATATARVSADGEHLAFLSAAAIPPVDNTDADTGAPDTELYLYGPPPGGGSPRLLCPSCNPTGERPLGSASIPGTVANGSSLLYRPRVLSAGGDRVFFDSADKLVVPDTDGTTDVYEWEAAGVGGCTRAPGCLGLISGGRGEGGRFLDASESGDDVFFLTGESLVGSDPGSLDVYDDRVGGGFPEPPVPIPCVGDACQALPSPPEDPGPGTLVPTSGNPPLKVEKLKGRHRCAKGKVRRNGFCLRRLHHHRGHARHHHTRKRAHR